MVILRMLNDFVGNLFAVTKYRFVIVVCGKIAIYHFCMVPYADLKIGSKTINNE